MAILFAPVVRFERTTHSLHIILKLLLGVDYIISLLTRERGASPKSIYYYILSATPSRDSLYTLQNV